MTVMPHEEVSFRAWIADKLFLGMTFSEYLKKLITPFNIVAALILAVGLPVTFVRFTQGLGAVTNLSHNTPWGLWIGVDILGGIALAAGSFILASAVYLFRLKDYYAIIRPAILTGFLGYLLEIVAVLFDLGRPWRLPYPIFVSHGVTSVMFLVGWVVFLYFACQFVQFSPAIFEWLGWKNLRRRVARLTIAATVFAAILFTVHQSALGALYLLAPGKLHPLWYTPLLPVLFLVSAVIAGISMVTFESMLSHRIFSSQISHRDHENFDNITIGLGKAAAPALFTYFCLVWIGVAHGHHWALLNTPLGHWFLVEVLGFVLVPCAIFVWAVRRQSVTLVRFAAIYTVIGILLNRINVSVVAFNWQLADRYFPKWTEFVVTLTVTTVGVLAFRWIVNRMPVLRRHPDYLPEYERG